MKKKDLKKLCLLGLTCGASLVAQGANAGEGVTLAGGCGGSSPRSFPQGSTQYAPSHSCGGAPSTQYYAPAPQSSCNGQARPISHGCGGQAQPQISHGCGGQARPQASCGGQAHPQISHGCGGQARPQGQPQASHGCGGFNRPQETAQRDQQWNQRDQQWGQNAPNAGNSKNFPSTMIPAQGNNPVNNQNLQNSNPTK